MRIQNNNLPAGMQKIYEKQVKPADKLNNRQIRKDDEVLLSPEARLFRLAREALNELPPMEEKNLGQLRDAVQKGTYRVDGKDIAELMMEGLLTD